MFQLIADILALTIGGIFPGTIVACDNKAAAVEIVTAHKEEGPVFAKAAFSVLSREGVCRVGLGPHRIEGLKENAVTIGGLGEHQYELAVVKMSHAVEDIVVNESRKMYWGVLVDVDIK
jgi:hypothetical protein